jgi:ribonuclease J
MDEENITYLIPLDPPAPGRLRLVPLGGLGEIGMNMMVYEYGDDIIIVDCGVMFPGEETPGVDLIIPDTTYLEDRKDRIRGVFLTHCHEDHIGALPYFLKELEVPVYGTCLTLGLIQPKLKEHKMTGDVDLVEVKPRDVVEAGAFMVEFVRMTHSTVDCVGMAISTPVGTIFHTGDFKIDLTPVDGECMDFHTLSRLGEEGVLLLLSDSTNSEREGYTLSEKEVGDTFDQIFRDTDGRIIATTFASNIHRIQQLIDMAVKYNRRVIFAGRSMVNNTRIANELGYLSIPAGVQATFGDMNFLDDNQILILTTGSQGEAMSALARMTFDEHKQVEIKEGDTVVISARVIPGNERSIARIINNLYRQGAKVYYEKVSEIHVSGHASQEEQKLMINMIKPKFFMPIHGEYRHLVTHAGLAERTGIPRENIMIAENGDVLEITPDSFEKIGHTRNGRVFVDGKGVGDVEDAVLRDRKHLSSDGFCIVTVGIDRHTGEIIRDPDVTSRGFIFEEEAEDLMAQAEQSVKSALEAMPVSLRTDQQEVQEVVMAALKRYLYKQTSRRPMILPVIIEL